MDRPGRNTARELRVQLNSALSDADPCPVRFELARWRPRRPSQSTDPAARAARVRFWVAEVNADMSTTSTRTDRITVTLPLVLVAPDGSHHSMLITGRELKAADESGCTPGSVSRSPRGGRGDGHPSRAGVATGLVRSTRGLGRAALERPRRAALLAKRRLLLTLLRVGFT
jgi:hypothetical protein